MARNRLLLSPALLQEFHSDFPPCHGGAFVGKRLGLLGCLGGPRPQASAFRFSRVIQLTEDGLDTSITLSTTCLSMNPTLNRRFGLFSCATRCLIELARRRGYDHITPDYMMERFKDRFPIWFSMPGCMDLMMLCKVVEELGMASKIEMSVDPKMVQEAVRRWHNSQNNGVLVFVERMAPPAESIKGPIASINYHAMLVVAADDRTFTLWTSKQDGDCKEMTYSWKAWPNLMAKAVILCHSDHY